MLAPNQDLDSASWWAALREHRIEVQACQRCNHRWVPPTPACPYCGSAEVSALPASGCGTVYSYVVVNRALSDNMAGQAPYTVATIDLDGGGRLFARTDGDAIAIGDRVSAQFVDHDSWTELRFAKVSS